MSYGYSRDLRECVLSYIEDGYTQKEASEVFNIPRQTIYNWTRLKRETGNLGMRRSGKRRPSKFDEGKLKEMVALRPDYYLSEIAVNFKATASGVCRALKRCGITRKKRVFSSRNETKESVKNFRCD
jgi:transposase